MKFSSLCISLVCLTTVSDAFMAPSTKIAAYPSSSSSPSAVAPQPTNPFHSTSASSASASASAFNSNTQLNAIPTNEMMSSSPLSQYFWQAVIDNGLPALFSIITIAVAAFFFKKAFAGGNDTNDFFENKNAIDELYSDLYGSTAGPKNSSPFGAFGGGGGGGLGAGGGGGLNKEQKRNLGIPSTQYIQVKNLNEKYASYDFSLKTATASKAAAAAEYRSQAFDRALQKALAPFGSDTSSAAQLPAHVKASLLSAEKEFLTEGKKLVGEIQQLEAQLVKASLDVEIVKMGMDKPYDPKPADREESDGENVDAHAGADADADSNNKKQNKKNTEETAKKMQQQNKKVTEKVTKELSKLQSDLSELELEFISSAVAAVGPERALGFRAALLNDVQARGSGGLLKQLERRPLSAFFASNEASVSDKNLFVMQFPGDVSASQLNELREEVTAIIRNAKPGDEALLVLQSGGGTVTGYGLAAGQLVRLKEKGIFLTIAVEQVAASGGYMMSCVADKIIASPFAVLGSIGVISEQPNVYERLKKEGIEFQTVTAGEFKRTLTPTKKVTREDFNKAKEDVEMILTQFSGFVAQNRPSLDIKSVATGETWFGQAALEKGLCDEIRPVDDVLLRYVDEGYQVYEIAYKAPQQVPAGLAALLPSTSAAEGGKNNSISKRMVRWLVSSVVEELKGAMTESTTLDQTQRYMAQDDTADRMKMEERL
ncbi:MAG: hypothetical protein SGBAC_011939 [Bacillariaceae sp.]